MVVIYGVCYTIWSVIWQAITDVPIYPVIDWFNEPGIAVGCVLILLVAVILVGGFLSWTKNKLKECYHPQKDRDDITSEEETEINQMP